MIDLLLGSARFNDNLESGQANAALTQVYRENTPAVMEKMNLANRPRSNLFASRPNAMGDIGHGRDGFVNNVPALDNMAAPAHAGTGGFLPFNGGLPLSNVN